MQRIAYRADLKQRGRELRRNGTIGEVLLWQQLRGKQMRGYQFNRQKPLRNYIADFYCHKLNLVIEIDGSSHVHEEAGSRDSVREKGLAKLGLHVLRFTEGEVREQMNMVLEKIDAWMEHEGLQNPPKSPFEKGDF